MNDITRRRALIGGGAMLPAAWLALGANVALETFLKTPSAGDDRELQTLVRELIARCKDFARMEAIYDDCDAAQEHYYDAYQGIVETAKCIHWCAQPGLLDSHGLNWVSKIYPNDIAWVLRREPPIEGLSEEFAELNASFVESLRGLSEWSAWPINPLFDQHEQWRDTVNAHRKLARTSEALRESRALTPGDRALKRRAIEHLHCGLGGKIAKAKYAYGFPDPPSRADLHLIVELNRERGLHLLRCRRGWRDWQWIYA